jgi:PPOX class probable F420-dependent enzyme
MTSEQVASFISEQYVGVLTTQGADGFPHSTGMWFLPGDPLLMWTYAKSQKAVNARRDPRCAFLLETGHAYDELRGVLIRGELELIEDVERVEDIGKRLYDRYTFPTLGVPVEDGPIVEIRRQAAKRIGLALPLKRVASWDHRKLGGAG